MASNHGLEIAGAKVQVLVSSRETVGRYTICRIDAEGPASAPLHAHSYEDGFFFVVEGETQFEIRGERIRAPKGTSLFIPRQTAYAFRCEGMARLLAIFNPGGMDLFLDDLAAAVRGGATPRRERLEQILEKHGITFEGEPQQA